MKKAILNLAILSSVIFFISFQSYGKKVSYNHETNLSIDYTTLTGLSQSSEDKTEVKNDVLDVNFMYGYLFQNNFLEAVIEVNYYNKVSSIKDVKKTITHVNPSFGLYVNIPLSDLRDNNTVKTPFKGTHWVPYSGLLFSSEDIKEKYTMTTDHDISSNYLVTKIVLGVRYKLYNHLYLNSQLRISLNTIKDTAKSGSVEPLSSKTSTQLELKLISISILF